MTVSTREKYEVLRQQHNDLQMRFMELREAYGIAFEALDIISGSEGMNGIIAKKAVDECQTIFKKQKTP